MSGYIEELLESGKKNFVFIGEAGCGKTEAAVNFAVEAAAVQEEKAVRFFDMDQTKPMFRAREISGAIREKGVDVRYEEQLLDARTMVGGPEVALKDPGCITVMDIGGDHQGSRMIGGMVKHMKSDDTKIFFMINPFRPWSCSIEAIDRTMAAVLGVAHLGLEDVSVMSNPNVGTATKAEDVLEGHRNVLEMTDGYLDVECICVREDLASAVAEQTDIPVIPLKIYMKYDWEK